MLRLRPLSTNRSKCRSSCDFDDAEALLRVYTREISELRSKFSKICDPRFPVDPVSRTTVFRSVVPGPPSTGIAGNLLVASDGLVKKLYLLIMFSMAAVGIPSTRVLLG